MLKISKTFWKADIFQ